MRHIDEIIIHCTATSPKWMADKSAEEVKAEVTRWHVEDNKWSDCGYHVLVHRDGSIASARPVTRSGAHCRGRNKSSIGVALVGGRGGCLDDAFLDNYTPEQEQALRDVIDNLKTEFPSIEMISGHSDYANKACPCFNVKKWVEAEV